MVRNSILFFFILTPCLLFGMILIPMDDDQANHLKAYGLAYKALQDSTSVEWLLNYRGGSFIIKSDKASYQNWAMTRNITFSLIDEAAVRSIEKTIEQENMTIVKLDHAPRVAVYAPSWNSPWDDAVTLAMEYAEIPYTKLWDEEVLGGSLKTDNFDWLHLHHEDFTGQHGKFWFGYSHEKWYIDRSSLFEKIAHKLGFSSVQEEKKAVALKIKEFMLNGGFLFAMCAATDTLDIALSSIGIDIIPAEIDGSPTDPEADKKLDFTRTLAFENFKLSKNAYEYEFSDIDIEPVRENIYYNRFSFKLNEFAAKYDTIPTMLLQNHRNLIKGFLGQTTGYRLGLIKKDMVILDTIDGSDWCTYIHGDRGKGSFTFLGGHDPEDYAHKVGDPPTNLDLFPNSPGYRLILNNILFPASKEKKRKT